MGQALATPAGGVPRGDASAGAPASTGGSGSQCGEGADDLGSFVSLPKDGATRVGGYGGSSVPVSPPRLDAAVAGELARFGLSSGGLTPPQAAWAASATSALPPGGGAVTPAGGFSASDCRRM